MAVVVEIEAAAGWALMDGDRLSTERHDGRASRPREIWLRPDLQLLAEIDREFEPVRRQLAPAQAAGTDVYNRSARHAPCAQKYSLRREHGTGAGLTHTDRDSGKRDVSVTEKRAVFGSTDTVTRPAPWPLGPASITRNHGAD